ncbi:Pyruvate kinase II [Piscirickettsia salmonis]|uniref:Pyruvate kinase n=1 Tax=Piscirickettsia salmonis TaxID=1238 RepID=A0A1L6TH08_PISSA|nr:pyruvate kinase [Piscirickettsia salmonis]AKP73064.1 pyruvate kinase [Piscirickettsia salmonis LF-89 = ATCC VR-1361]ALB21709.1 pyruvate kinase [Piscirickettsia salmonis]ALY01906.1 pyruvate kinase [Piscirickettsia salmonis]AMA41415.1 pyruvate kinase [Piscirickettsia salmonis]AOS36619.1 pyruvate kinase [Piscirickettsia salmonis]
MKQIRRTKIVTTLGPATETPEVLERVLKAGANVVRLNFSHGEAEDHMHRAELVRSIAKKLDLNIAILGDLQGPKIRIARFKAGKVVLEKGADFILDAALDSHVGDDSQVGIDYKELPNDVGPGDVLLLDDGRLVFKVKDVTGTRVLCEVVVGGELSNNKGINRQGGGMSAAALTDKDRADIITAAKIGVDFVAVSFPRSAEDMQEARRLLDAQRCSAALVAKIERAEAVSDQAVLDEIISASDAVMVARGDLGVEIGDAELIGVQKKIIQRARTLDRVVITATQMMESMIYNAMPTRAEVFDVANAVLDGTDAVMLSAETATGDYPEEVVAAMSRVCLGAERERKAQVSRHRVECEFLRIDEAVAMATMYAANHLKGVKAIICLTESGATPLWMSRIHSGLPIFALSRNGETRRRLALVRGVEALEFDPTYIEPKHEVNQIAVNELQKRGLLADGDIVILTKGDHQGIHGGTNAIKILRVGQIA